jgi:S-formylglutathione hydrolase FrmB
MRMKRVRHCSCACMKRVRPVSCVCMFFLLLLAGSASANRLVTLDVTSANVDPAQVTFNERRSALKVNVLLPDGFDEQPGRRWPVMYLLHGVGDGFDTWAVKGQVAKEAAGFPGIIVMPEGARGFYLDWWKDGGPRWERYLLDELVPLVERRFPIRAGRRWHAIAGVSMGGLGAAYLAGQKPGYFGSAAVFSGFVDPNRPEVHTFFQAIVPEASFADVWGPPDGYYARIHSPAQTPGNLKHTRVWVTAGDGVTEPAARDSVQAVAVGGAAESVVIAPQVKRFVDGLNQVGASVTWVPHHGVHEWAFYWRRALREAIAWDVFAPVATAPRRWETVTASDRGELWGLTYRFPSRPANAVTFARDGGTLRIDGPATRVTLRPPGGCVVRRAVPSVATWPRCSRTRSRR